MFLLDLQFNIMIIIINKKVKITNCGLKLPFNAYASRLSQFNNVIRTAEKSTATVKWLRTRKEYFETYFSKIDYINMIVQNQFNPSTRQFPLTNKN